MAIAISGLKVANEFLHVIDVVIQVKLTLRHRHQAGIFPVGDVDLMVFEHGLNRITQQCGVVARQRRHDQYRRLTLEFGQCGRVIAETLEAAQFAKRLVDLNALMDGHGHAINVDRAQAELRLFVVFAQTVHQVVAGRNALCERALPEQA